MSKKLMALLVVVILAIAALTGCAMAVYGKGDTESAPEVSLATNGDAGTQLKDVSANYSFVIYSKIADIDTLADYVSVVDSLGNPVAVTFKTYEKDGFFKVVAPGNGYAAGGVYRISLKAGVIFDGSLNPYSVVDFIIEKQEILDVELNDNVVVLDDARITADGKVLTQAVVAVGSYIIVPIENEAYNAFCVKSISRNGGEYVLEVSDPEDLADVFGDIDIYKKFLLSDGSLRFNDEDIAKAAEEIETSFAIGDYLPEFSITRKEIDKDNSKAYFDFKLAYTYQGFEFAILFENDIAIDPEVNYSTIPFSIYVGADMVVVTDIKFQISTGYSASGRENLEDVINGIEALQEKEFTQKLAKLMHWEVAYGPISLAFDVDLVFGVNLKGEVTTTATATTAYSLGAYYVDGNFESYADKQDISGFEFNSIELYGKAGATIGFANTLTLKLVQVASVGIEADIGLYLDVYGCVNVNLQNVQGTVAGIYGDCGFYYDVKLIAAVGILDFKFDKSFSLVSGKISFFTFGDRKLVLDFAAAPEVIEISSNQEILPSVPVKEYDLVDRTITEVELAPEEVILAVADDAYFTVSDYVLTLKASAPTEFGYTDVNNQVVTYKLAQNENVYCEIRIAKKNNLPYALNAIATFDKAYPDNVIYELDLLTAEYVGISGIEESSVQVNTLNNGHLQILVPTSQLVTKPNGKITLTVTTRTGSGENASYNTLSLWINVQGALSITAMGKGEINNPWRIYNADQLVEFSQYASKYNYFSAKYLVLMNDIDLSGYDFGTVISFRGFLDGKGYTISGLNIDTVSEGYTGFIAKNYGTISNLNINVNIARSDASIVIGGIAGYNVGTIDNCTVRGSLSNSYETGASRKANVKVGGVVGYNEGTVKNTTAYNSVSVALTGSNVSSVAYGAGIVGYNKGTVENVTASGSVSVSVKGWHDGYSNAIANN